jgi:hypothetical protein
MATAKKAAPKKTATKAKKAAPSTEATSQRFQDYLISKKRSGRFEVKTSAGQQVNGPEKAKILVEAKLVKTGLPKAKEEAAPSA